MTWRTENKFSEETICILEIAQHFLKEYFGHEDHDAEIMIGKYFQKVKMPDPESVIGHVLSWEMAKRVHYAIGLGHDPDGQITWEIENNLRNTPREALAYMRNNYWNKFPMFGT